MFRPYKKEEEYSYTLGAFPTVELIKCRPECVRAVLIHSKFIMTDEVKGVLEKLPAGVPVVTDDRSVERVAKKGNTFVVGVFDKKEYPLSGGNQIALFRPSDTGNLGTIIRTAVGFGVKDIVIIGDGADVFDPKTVRASMGAIFRVSIKRHETLEAYAAGCDLPKYMFMLGASAELTAVKSPNQPCALVFGNEASGLPDEAAEYGQPVVIRHSDEIDSLALPQAVAIGLHYFFNKA